MSKVSAILAKFRNIFKHKAHASLEQHLINPERDWRVVLIFFALSVIASAAAHYIIYIKFDVAPLDIIGEPPVTRFLLKDELAKTVSEYKTKETNLNTLMSSRPAVVDPSN